MVDKKRNLWPFLFIGIFSFTLYMIFWTIYKTSQSPIHAEEVFMSSYHDVDANFDRYLIATDRFNKLYSAKLVFNAKEIPMSSDDIYKGQRSLEANNTHKDMLKVGHNSFLVVVNDKNGSVVNNADIKARVTSSAQNSKNIDLNKFNFVNGTFASTFDVESLGYYNITGEVSIGEEKGYFFIKTNAISK